MKVDFSVKQKPRDKREVFAGFTICSLAPVLDNGSILYFLNLFCNYTKQKTD